MCYFNIHLLDIFICHPCTINPLYCAKLVQNHLSNYFSTQTNFSSTISSNSIPHFVNMSYFVRYSLYCLEIWNNMVSLLYLVWTLNPFSSLSHDKTNMFSPPHMIKSTCFFYPKNFSVFLPFWWSLHFSHPLKYTYLD